MYASVIVVCLIGSTFADPYLFWPNNYNQQAASQQGSQGQGADQGYYGAAAGQAGQAGGEEAAAQQSANAAQASRIEAAGASRDEAAAGMRRRQSVLLAADQEEGAGFEGEASSSSASGAADSGAVVGYCSGVPMTGSQHLCCNGQYYGNTWSELSCCGNSVFDARFYGCNNNIMSPLYRPVASQPTNGKGRLCGNYVWQMYDAPYELCCDGVYYPNPYGNYGCCGARAFDNRYYSCGRDEVKQKWYVYKRSTFVLAATEELEAVGSRSQSAAGRINAEEGAVAASQGSARQQAAAQGASQGGQVAGARADAASAGQGSQAAERSQAYASPYGPYGLGAWGFGAPGK